MKEISTLNKATRHFESGNFEQSLTTCLNYLESYPNDIIGLRLKANLYAIDGNLVEAIDALNKISLLTGAREPSDYFLRGRCFLKNGDTALAVKDFETVFELCAEYKNDYYLGAAHLHYAYAHAMSGESVKAEKSLIHINDSSTTSIGDKLINKSYIIKLINN